MSCRSAQRAASVVETARSAGTGAASRSVSMSMRVLDECECESLAETAEGGEERSFLLPTSSSVRSGEASARASVRKVGSEANEACEVMS